ncbi:hypothetical protein FRC10_000238 [Ceratobasidium sp. 414]|nr:hypothetical protein FRC10_000238 [Ceratobasidium sp. 414]
MVGLIAYILAFEGDLGEPLSSSVASSNPPLGSADEDGEIAAYLQLVSENKVRGLAYEPCPQVNQND